MQNILKFTSRSEFRNWLGKNAMSKDGVWLLFGKAGGPKTLKSVEAQEEALCLGWIDGQMQSLDQTSYKKYFCKRRIDSNWSDKNKKLAMKLEKQGLMTDYGRSKMEEAKQNGQWDKPKSPPITEEEVAMLSGLLQAYEPAYTNFQAMPPSVKKTYTKAYLDAKTDAGRASRMLWMVERLNKNLKPM